MSYGNKMSLDEIHKSSLSLLEFFHDICLQNNLTYYLAYGTLLGCVRHQGYIPWDDDIDIWMPRSSYDQLIQLFEQSKYKIGDYYLLSRESSEYVDYSIIRVTDLRYKLIQKNSKCYPDMGTFIDIYPLDSVKSQSEFDEAYKRIGKYNWLYAVYLTWASPSKLKVVPKFLIHYSLRLRYGKHYLSKVQKSTENIINKYTSEDYNYFAVINWFTTGKKVYSKEWFSNTAALKFENLTLNVPSGYHELLSVIYGDYMKLPSEEERTSYHDYEIYRRHN